MEIEFVNHASFVVTQDEIKLLIDPWLEGYAFYEGWAHVSQTKFSYEDFSSITHIWFSHEHPDHFSPPVLKKIPASYREKITILYQKTADKKVVGLCKKMGFGKVVELEAKWVPLSDTLKVYNKPHTDGDSWICIKSPDCTLLDLNDCVTGSDPEVMAIKNVVGDVNVLFTQFSYANWAGNREDLATRQKAASDKLEELSRQVRVLGPAFVVPFASYIWFCHAENFYLNDSVNKIDFIYDFILKNTSATPVVLYPGDRWNINKTNYDPRPAIDQYMRDWDTIMSAPPLVRSKPVDAKELTANAKKFAEDLSANNSFLIKLLKPAMIYIEDYKAAYKFSLKQGLEPVSVPSEYCDIIIGADALNYCFKFLWGGGTLRVNGRYQVPPKGSYFNFKILFQIAQLNNFGEKFDLKYILDQGMQRIKSKLK
jgi:UDP-MurNAc hydroxylase